jgi:hypothetical protein
VVRVSVSVKVRINLAKGDSEDFVEKPLSLYKGVRVRPKVRVGLRLVLGL